MNTTAVKSTNRSAQFAASSPTVEQESESAGHCFQVLGKIGKIIVNEFKNLINFFKKDFVRKKLPLETEVCWWLLVSILDFIMTYLLLLHPSGFVESNPIALRFFHDWGFKGLLGYKLFMALFVIVVCQIIARNKIETARRVFQFGTIVVGCVVVYSVMLYARGGQMPQIEQMDQYVLNGNICDADLG